MYDTDVIGAICKQMLAVRRKLINMRDAKD